MPEKAEILKYFLILYWILANSFFNLSINFIEICVKLLVILYENKKNEII